MPETDGMRRLWERSELRFAAAWICAYVTGNGLLDGASAAMGMEMALTLPFDALLIAVLLRFVKANGLGAYYGLCAPRESARRMLYYVPLAVVATANIWFGFSFNRGLADGAVYALAMAAVGIAEELLFRGLLFRALCRRSVRSAVALTSILFGAGHIVNLFNGSGTAPLESACQLAYAAAIGLLLAVSLLRSGSLLPGMVAHAVFNALSMFANNAVLNRYQIPAAALLCAVSLAGAVAYRPINEY